jgi:Na+/proline symporter
LFIVTLGFYSWYWVYKTQEETKQHTGDGLGGVLGLVVWIVIGAVSAFVIPSEIGRMYQKDGQHSPVTGWTGLWLFPFGFLIIPAIVWFVKVQESLNTYWGAKASSGVAADPAEA